MADFNAANDLFEQFTSATYTDPTLDYLSDTSGEFVELCEGSKPQEFTVMIVEVILFIVIFIFGVIGNGLVIATFARYRWLRMRCMTDVFLFYLALSDLLLLLTLPLMTSEAVQGKWMFGDGLCRLNQGMYAINTNGGLLLLACISIDRYLVVVQARAAQRLRPSMLRYSKLSAIAVALISIIFSLPELFFSTANFTEDGDVGRCEMYIFLDNSEWVKKCTRVAKITGFCIPCAAMLVCYSAIGHVLQQGGGNSWRRQRTLRLMMSLVLLFLLFQLPYTIVQFIRMFPQELTCHQWNGVNLSEHITRTLALIRCCLNPVLYALVGVKLRNDVVRLLHDCGCVFACLKHLKLQPSSGSSVTPSSPPPTLTALPAANGHPTLSFTSDTPPQTQVDSKESSTPNTFPLSAEWNHKDPTYVGWGQH